MNLLDFIYKLHQSESVIVYQEKKYSFDGKNLHREDRQFHEWLGREYSVKKLVTTWFEELKNFTVIEGRVDTIAEVVELAECPFLKKPYAHVVINIEVKETQ